MPSPLDIMADGYREAMVEYAMSRRRSYRVISDVLQLQGITRNTVDWAKRNAATAHRIAKSAIMANIAADAKRKQGYETDATNYERRRWGHNRQVMGPARGINLGVEKGQISVSHDVPRPDSTAKSAFRPKSKRTDRKNWRAPSRASRKPRERRK